MFDISWKAILKSDKLVPIPLYHLTARKTGSLLINNNSHNVQPENLANQLKIIKKKYEIIPLDELAEEFLRKKNIDNVTSVTFDDGYLSVLREGAPVFEQLGIPFTFFINGKLLTEQVFWRDKVRAIIEMDEIKGFLSNMEALNDLRWVDVRSENFYKKSKSPKLNSKQIEKLIDEYLTKRNLTIPSDGVYCTWDDVCLSNRSLIQYGNHSYGHYVLSSLSQEDQYSEILTNKELIIDKLKSHSSIFSIPFGNPGTYNDETLAIIKDLGYKGYVLSGPIKHCKELEIDKFGLLKINRFMPADEPFIKGL